MIRKVYLELSAQSLVIAAAANVALKGLWLKPLNELLVGSFKERQWDRFLLAATELLGLYLCYKLASAALLWAFDRFRRVRVFVDKVFDVEGVYLESVFINGDLEVVGINRVAFVDGELKVDSNLYWPARTAEGDIALTEWARTTSVNELCTASNSELQYVFRDNYITRPELNKSGLTKLALHRERTPSWKTRWFGHPGIESYSGGFDAFDNEIRGVIRGTRLDGVKLRTANGTESDRKGLLVAEVKAILDSGTGLRQQPPGEFVPK
jgi:hypothetical protein